MLSFCRKTNTKSTYIFFKNITFHYKIHGTMCKKRSWEGGLAKIVQTNWKNIVDNDTQ